MFWTARLRKISWRITKRGKRTVRKHNKRVLNYIILINGYDEHSLSKRIVITADA
nr:MAG TPA: hypothetical protein [Caudoviricetes sp.]